MICYLLYKILRISQITNPEIQLANNFEHYKFVFQIKIWEKQERQLGQMKKDNKIQTFFSEY